MKRWIPATVLALFLLGAPPLRAGHVESRILTASSPGEWWQANRSKVRTRGAKGNGFPNSKDGAGRLARESEAYVIVDAILLLKYLVAENEDFIFFAYTHDQKWSDMAGIRPSGASGVAVTQETDEEGNIVDAPPGQREVLVEEMRRRGGIYPHFNRDYPQARREIQDILADIGAPALPYLREAIDDALRTASRTALPQDSLAVRTGWSTKSTTFAVSVAPDYLAAVAAPLARISPEEYRTVVSRMADRRSEKALPLLVAALDNTSPEIRRLAARGLGLLPRRQAAAALVEHLSETHPSVRDALVNALEKLAGRKTPEDALGDAATLQRFWEEWLEGPGARLAVVK